MDRNFVIAMVLMVLVLLAWQYIFPTATPPKQPLGSPVGQTPGPGASPTPTPAVSPAPGAVSPTPGATPTPTPAGAATTAAVTPTPAAVTTPPVKIAVANQRVNADLTNDLGGSFRHWDLLDYNFTTHDKKKPWGEREKVDLAPYQRALDPIKTERLKTPVVFRDQPQLVCALDSFAGLDGSSAWEEGEHAPDHLTLRASAGGVTLTKTLRFHTQGRTPSDLPYNLDVAMAVRNDGAQPASVQPFCAVYEQVLPDTSSFFYRDYNQMMQTNYINNSLTMTHIAKVKLDSLASEATYWTGFADNYFAELVAPDQETIPVADARAKLALVTDNKNIMEARLLAPKTPLAPGQSREFVFKVYLGPKLRDFIAAGDDGAKFHFDKSIDFGWFDVIARYLQQALIWLAKATGNYGVAILILTIVIKLLLFPLQHKSIKSMRAMQLLQPEIAKLREQYKDNKEKMNQELMGLYKRHNVNPAGGCLPLLIQLPIFIAFYRALGYSIELRQTPFVGWLQDLSAQDPYYIPPILMGVSMFLSQKMTPSAGDPSQQKIMMLMPLLFTFMFLSFPSGLVLYWLTNNILSIVQQVITNKYLPAPPVARPAAVKGK